MSLRLVHGDNVEQLDVHNFQDIASMARSFADEVEKGEHGKIVSITLLIESDNGLARETWGEVPTGYELIGMLDAAKFAVLTDDYDEE